MIRCNPLNQSRSMPSVGFIERRFLRAIKQSQTAAYFKRIAQAIVPLAATAPLGRNLKQHNHLPQRLEPIKTCRCWPGHFSIACRSLEQQLTAI